MTISGSLTFQDGSKLVVYGPADGKIGKVIINNNSYSAAIQNNSEDYDSYLTVYSGELEITSADGLITNGVYLENGGDGNHYMEYKMDGKPLVYDENKKLFGGKTIKIDGTKLTLTWCEHKSEYVTYVPSSETQHIMNCAQCGFEGKAMDCTFNGYGGYDPGDDNGHYAKCICGNKDSNPSKHSSLEICPTDDGKHHVESCRDCGYAGNDAVPEDHSWDPETGKCTDCGFVPVATDNKDNLYGYIEDALAAVADSKAEYAKLYSQKTDKEINDRKTSMVLGERNITIYGKGFIEDELCGCTFRISPTSFYQVNPQQTERLYKKAISCAKLTGKETVIDAYCGTGTIGLIASSKAKKVIGVERLLWH